MPPDIGVTTLVGMYIENIENLPLKFKLWDTTYSSDFMEAHYALPKSGKVIILILLSEGNLFNQALWTTIRRYIPYKEKYYRGLIGQEVEIEINFPSEVSV